MPESDRSAGEFDERLERTLNIFPPLDHGLTLLGGGHAPSGGRKVNGGIMVRPGYKGPTVNIRPPKWTEKSFWIRTDNYNDAMYIADAVFYHIGRGPFHFTNMTFQYPPLRLATRELRTREACAVYVESIAKGPAHEKQREDYRDLVKELVLKAVKSPEAVLFLSSLRPSTSSDGAAVESDANEGRGAEVDSEAGSNDDAIVEEDVVDEAVEDVGYNVGDEFADQATPMEVDHVSEQAIQVVSEPVMAASGYIPSFGIASASLDLWFASGSILHSDFLDAGCYRSGKQAEGNASVGNIQGFLSLLDKEEKAAYEWVDESAFVQWRAQFNP